MVRGVGHVVIWTVGIKHIGQKHGGKRVGRGEEAPKQKRSTLKAA